MHILIYRVWCDRHVARKVSNRHHNFYHEMFAQNIFNKCNQIFHNLLHDTFQKVKANTLYYEVIWCAVTKLYHSFAEKPSFVSFVLIFSQMTIQAGVSIFHTMMVYIEGSRWCTFAFSRGFPPPPENQGYESSNKKKGQKHRLSEWPLHCHIKPTSCAVGKMNCSTCPRSSTYILNTVLACRLTRWKLNTDESFMEILVKIMECRLWYSKIYWKFTSK